MTLTTSANLYGAGQADRVEVEDATADQLRTFASQVLGIEIGGRENKPTMIGKMAEVGYAMSFINLPPSAPAPSGGPSQRGAFNTRVSDKVGEDGNLVKEIRIILHTKDEPGGDRAVPVSVNGKSMLIPRGTEEWVPEHFVEALDHAEEDIYDEYSEGLGGLKKPRTVKSYPYSYA